MKFYKIQTQIGKANCLFIIASLIFSFSSCTDKLNTPPESTFKTAFFEDNFDADSLKADWTIIKGPLDEIKVVNKTLMVFNEPTVDDYPVVFLNKSDYNKSTFQLSVDFKSDYDSLGHRFNLLGLTSVSKDPQNANAMFAVMSSKIGIAVGMEQYELELTKVPKGNVWYNLKLENIEKTITMILSVKDGPELGRISLTYTGNIEGYWGIGGAFKENWLNSRSMVYFDNFRILQP